MKLQNIYRITGVLVFCLNFPAQAQSIMKAEYFFNTDPGVGLGKEFTITPGTHVDVEIEINTEDLSDGFHTLFVRFRDEQGHWSLSEGRTFLIEQLQPTETKTITNAEYFFDNDPGVGNGISLPHTASGQVNLVTEISTEGLENGFHILFIRFRDQEGTWSLSEGRAFLIEQPQNVVDMSIIKAEYFMDTDPGVGKGISLPVAAGGLVDLTSQIDTEGLESGFHNLFLRFQDQLGNWGLAEGRMFFLDHSVSSFAHIVAAEYFFDDTNAEPGKGTALAIKPAANLSLEEEIELPGLDIGKHRLHLRLQDNLGVWSNTEIKEFTIANPRLDAITPISGGNVGDVTVNLIGASFDKGTKVKFTRNGLPDIEVPDSLIIIINGEQIQATVDLRERDIGDYDVVVELNSGTELIISNGFSVLEGVNAHPWAEILGFDRIRIGQWQTYTVTYGNKGNVDAMAVPLWIQVPEDSEYTLDFELFKPESNLISWDTIPESFIADEIPGIQEEARIIPLVIPNMAPNEIGTLTFKLKTDSSEDFVISAWASSPMYQSPLNPDVLDCYANIAATVLGVVPGVGCLYSFLDLGLRPLVKVVTTGSDGLFSGDHGLYDSNGKFKSGDFSASVLMATVGCIPGENLIGNVGKIMTIMAAAGHVKDWMNAITSCTIPFRSKEPKKKITVSPVASFDPNNKLGLEGPGDKNFISGSEIFPYLIQFENKESATAAAQEVLIIDTLDRNKLDISSLQLGFFSFGDRIVNVPPGRKSYSADVDLRPENDLIVRIEAKLDEEKGILTWLYTSLDPSTLLPTENPEAGFLPPNKTAPQGDGGVFFTVRPKADLQTDAAINNIAYIFFDNNEVIPTPVWTNSIDKAPPVSHVTKLTSVQLNNDFLVNWSGTDEGSGIAGYSIYVAENDQPYKVWLENVTTTSATFSGEQDSTYHFYSIAIDSTGLAESTPNVEDTFTTISLITGIMDEEIKKQIVVYPNPAYHTLTVELPELLYNSTISLINVYGTVMLKKEAENANTHLFVNQLPKGMYLLRISNQDYVITKKLIIK